MEVYASLLHSELQTYLVREIKYLLMSIFRNMTRLQDVIQAESRSTIDHAGITDPVAPFTFFCHRQPYRLINKELFPFGEESSPAA